MSTILRNNMGNPFFHELKKQASFFFKEKFRTARLALTDVTPTELLTEEATNGSPWAPDARTMGLISRAAFEIDDYYRIVEILHKRLLRFDRKYWRESYKALILLEHLLTHGPESVALEFQTDRDVIQELGSFQYIDERGFNWGMCVRKKSERVLQLLDMGQLLKEERDRSRKLTRGIEGFGSFCHRSSSTDASFRESSFSSYGRSNSQYNDHLEQEEESWTRSSSEFSTNSSYSDSATSDLHNPEICSSNPDNQLERSISRKENPVSSEELKLDELHESKPLLGSEKEKKIEIPQLPEEDHPFSEIFHQTTVSLLSVNQG